MWVESLTAALPVEDIWLLSRNAARECALEADQNLIILVANDQPADEWEPRARAIVEQSCGPEAPAVFVFPVSAMEQVPRPLLVKMALTAGERIYCR